jgi:hypothetical protein
MWRSRDGDATDVAGALKGHRVDMNRPKSVERRDGFRASFLFLQLFLIEFQLLPI